MVETHLFFIADGRRLELQSWLLATSLAAAHRDADTVQLHAYAGRAWLPQIADITRVIYEAAGVTLHVLPDPPAWAAPYPHGNKIVAATDRRGPGRAVFLDTDMVCLAPLTGLAGLPENVVAAAPEGKATWGPEARWHRAYAHFGLPLPEARVQLLRGKRKWHVPYFNAGLVAFHEPAEADSPSFADRWLETALDFDHRCAIANKRPWLDQITLPLTVARFGYGMEVLDESYNYSLSNRADYAATPEARILHYHRSRFLQQAPQWPSLLAMFFETLPARHHASAIQGLRDLGLEVAPSGRAE